MAQEILKDGEHLLSGVGYFHEDNIGTFQGETDGVVLILDGCFYCICEDRSDSYRSYGYLAYASNEIICKSHITTFPPQCVTVINTEIDKYDDNGYPEDKQSYICIYNKDNGNLICKVGTDYTDSFYPMAIFYWNPLNLPINMKVTYETDN